MNRRGNLLDQSTINIARSGNSILDFDELHGNSSQRPDSRQRFLITDSTAYDDYSSQLSGTEYNRRTPRFLNDFSQNNREDDIFSQASSIERIEPQRQQPDNFLNQTTANIPRRKSLLFDDVPKTATTQVNKPILTRPVQQSERNPAPSDFSLVTNQNPPSAPVRHKSLFDDDEPPKMQKEVPPPIKIVKPDEDFQRKVTASIDSSLSNFKRIMLRDIQAAFRVHEKECDDTLDTFSSDLVDKIDTAVKSIGFYSDDPKFAASKVAGSIEEGKKEIRALFSDFEVINAGKKERKQEHLSDINAALTDLIRDYKEITNNVLSTFNRIQSDTSAQHVAQESQRRINERKLRSYKNKKLDLEAYASRQTMELDQVKKLLAKTQENLDHKSRKDNKAEKNMVSKRIREEIDKVLDSLNSDSISNFEDACCDVTQKISDVNNDIIGDFEEIDMVEQATMMSLRNTQY